MPLPRVYFNEYNLLMGRASYLPLVSGLLQAYALTRTALNGTLDFRPYHFYIDVPSRLIERHEQPFVAAFSLALWNEQLNLVVAREVKRRYPDCKIVFGGAQVPHDPRSFMNEHEFVDVAVRGEGEEAFADILERLLIGEGLDAIPGVAWRTASGEIRVNGEERAFNRNLDVYPSPYLHGLYESLFTDYPNLEFQAIIETNRGCPFHCTFCYWGKGGLSRKYRFTSLERTFAEIDWAADHRIRYIFNADSNFGMHKRDVDISLKLVETRERTGFPEAFRTCYGKNTSERILEIGKLLHRHGLEKGITISYQSVSPVVQLNIKRDNIKLAVAEALQRDFNDAGVPVYSELILGLPGESAASWMAGIDTVLGTGLKNQLYLYICQVLPNTELSNPDYRRLFGLEVRRIEAIPVHGSVRDADWVPEFEDILVASNTMPLADWRRMQVLSWLVMLMHGLKVGVFVLDWLYRRLGIPYSALPMWLIDTGGSVAAPCWTGVVASFYAKVDSLLAGGGRGSVVEDSGGLYWEQEEVAFLTLAPVFDVAIDELLTLIPVFLHQRGITTIDVDELSEVCTYQRRRLPPLTGGSLVTQLFQWNLPEWFEHFFDSEPPNLTRVAQDLTIHHIDYQGDRARFGREVLLRGRRNGRILPKADWTAMKDMGNR
ncbi:putative methyltransferase [Gammaproteobacteria bacterium]